ncbi:transglycosylase domain-containing protein [Pseudoclavibacter helvolus]|uniref:Membrane peptidoglycan carboxypeptidase n=1 Tax=Pseudoclavibacter helvolus TaxID=255205 RepID=A0A7W4UQS9_9MICO|nr:transglycosylase domain-containing protein [Pseudoclavibacter helvolus]MBB2958899.1 membrane peptidoglycan carboxypeptidase [Pseudoclavibacter helvolus]
MATKKRGSWKRGPLTRVLGLVGVSGLAAVLITALVTPLVSVANIAENSSINLFESLPDYLEINELQQVTELYAKQGGQDVKFAQFYNQNRIEVPLDQISPWVPLAAISVEDPRFREHDGVDVISAARALVTSVIGDASAGASTITMQWVRNVRVQEAEAILDPAESEKAYIEATDPNTGRKLQEMRLAIGVEQQYSKDEILQGYLNIALFGGTTYGIESAAQRYFGKPALDLNLQEAASLIAIVQEPNAYRLDREENIAGNKERRDYILMRMMEEGAIDQATYEATIALPVEPNVKDPNHGCEFAEGNAKYFCKFVQLSVLQDEAFGATEAERMFNLAGKGYKIYTSLDLDMQGVATQSMQNAVPATYPGTELGAAASMVENGTGRILAMVQNTQFSEVAENQGLPGVTSVNYNADYEYGGSTGFQTGSTYKIFTLAEWLASGKSLYSSIPGQNRTFYQEDFSNTCEAETDGPWAPTNDSGQRVGTVSVKSATASSINTAYVSMAERLDQCRIRDTAMALGGHRADGAINSSLPSAILGAANEMAPLSMATVMSGLANSGVTCTPTGIDRVTLRDGTEVAGPESRCIQAVTPQVAAGVDEALAGVVEGGTGSRSNPGIVPLIGKTGTTDNGLQTWMVGATTKVGLAVWVGNANGLLPMYDVDLPLAAGSQTRHVLFNEIIGHAMSTYGGGAFPEYVEDEDALVLATVPDLTGRSTEEARQVLEGLGFGVSIGPSVDSDQSPGSVANTLPTANTRVDKGTTITIHPSALPEDATRGLLAPDVAGKTQDEATALLAGAGFSGTVTVIAEKNATVPSGQVIRTDPSTGTPIEPTGQIRLFVSSGP